MSCFERNALNVPRSMSRRSTLLRRSRVLRRCYRATMLLNGLARCHTKLPKVFVFNKIQAHQKFRDAVPFNPGDFRERAQRAHRFLDPNSFADGSRADGRDASSMLTDIYRAREFLVSCDSSLAINNDRRIHRHTRTSLCALVQFHRGE